MNFSKTTSGNLNNVFKGEIIMGIFGDLFDFNNDGKLDAFEKAAEFGMLMQMIESEEQDEEDDEEIE